MKTMLTVAILALAAQAEKKAHSTFDQIKKLEGSWESTDKDHPCSVTYKPGSGGSVMVETMAMGNHGEMLTVYHPDGDDLVLTHYCMVGNQPRMRAAKEQKAGALKFDFDGGANMKPADKHMHSLTVTFVDADHVKQEWAMFDGGKEQMVVTINLARKK
jgi:hypothetical protein